MFIGFKEVKNTIIRKFVLITNIDHGDPDLNNI